MQTQFTILGKSGSYTIRFNSALDTVWLENHMGEGMEIAEDKLFDVLDAYFKSAF